MSKDMDLHSPRSPDGQSVNQTPNVPKVLTRGVVARMLRCTLGGVRYYERKGALKPKKDRDGVRRFDRAEVEALGRRLRRNGHRTNMGPTGDLAAEVFRMFRDGQSLAEIVIKTQETPETIRMLWEEYKRPLDQPEKPTVVPEDLSDYAERAREIEGEIMARRRRMRGGE